MHGHTHGRAGHARWYMVLWFSGLLSMVLWGFVKSLSFLEIALEIFLFIKTQRFPLKVSQNML